MHVSLSACLSARASCPSSGHTKRFDGSHLEVQVRSHGVVLGGAGRGLEILRVSL